MKSKNNNNFKYLFILILLLQYSCDLFYQPEESARIPDIPGNVTATVNSDNIIINWDFANNSNTYLVYKKVGNQEWSLISESLTTNSFIELDIVYDTDIYYGVKSENNGTFSELGQIPVPINIVYIVKIPALPQHVVAVVNEDNVTVNWDNNSINKHYMVFRKYDDKDWQPITELLVETKFVDYNFVWDTDVFYGVKGEINGLFSEIAEIQSPVISIPVPDIPGSVSATINGDVVNINWTAVDNANNYMVLLKYDGGEWESVSGLISGNSYIHAQGVIYDKDVLYGVKSEYKGKYSSIRDITGAVVSIPTPDSPLSINALVSNDGSVDISWSEVSNAENYEVFIKYDDRDWTPISGLLSTNQYKYTEVFFDKEVYYGVRSEYKGKFSDIVSISDTVISIPKPDAPSDVYAYVGEDLINISWSEAVTANNYKVYIKYDDNDWEEISTLLSEISFTDFNPIQDKDILYGVRSEYKGIFSDIEIISNSVILIHTPDSPLTVSANITGDNIVITWSSVSNADNYEVYIKYNNGDWATVSDLISDTSFTHTNVVYDTDVLYGVKSEYKGKYSEIRDITGSISAIPVPETPTNVYAETDGESVLITWSQVLKADNYQVFVKYDNIDWKPVSNFITGTSFSDLNVVYDKDLYYGVKSEYKGKFSTISSISSTVIVIPTPAMTYSVNATLNGNIGTVSWSEAEGTNQYRVYIKYDGEEWTPVSNLITGTSFIHTGVVYDMNLKYGVMSKYKDKYSEIKPMVNSIISIPYPDAPTNVNAFINEYSVSISWNQVLNAGSYVVYRKYNNGAWESISSSITEAIFTDTDIVYDENLYYGVKSEYKGLYSDIVSISQSVLVIPRPDTPLSVTADVKENSVDLSWSLVNNANNYEVYIKYDNGEWTPISGLISETVFTHTNVVYDTEVLYGVKAEYKGKYSEIRDITGSVVSIPSPDAPTNVNAIVDGNNVSISWSQVLNANNYKIYIKYDNNDWTPASNYITGTSFTDTNVVYDKNIYYGVKSEYKGKESEVSSASDTVILIPVPEKTSVVNATAYENSVDVNWSSVGSADKYRVYIKYNNEEWTPVSGLLSETSYTHTDIVQDIDVLFGVISEYKGKYSDIKSMTYTVISVPTPDNPSNVTAIVNDNSVTVSWSSVSNADKYVVCRKEVSGAWEPISSPIIGTSFTDTNVVYDENIYYGVKSEYKGKESDLISISQTVVIIPVPNLPTNVTATVNKISVTINWGLVSKADFYQVYLKYSAGNWITVSNWISENTFVDSSLNTDISVIYGVKANYKEKISEIATIPQNIILYHTPDTPQNVEATITDSSAQITWNDVSNAEKYEVLIRTEFGEWQSISSLITSNSYTHNNLIYDEKIYYGVRSEFTNNYSSIKSILIPIFTSHTPNDPTGVIATVNNTDISISWNSVTNADKYQVYRKAGNGDWISITGFINGTEYNDTSVIFDTTLYYGVQAEYSDNLSEIISIQDSVYLNHTPYNPSNVSVLTYSDHSELSWSAVSNANRYQVYRKDEGSIWTEISGLITATSYNDTSVVFDSDMVYGVRAEFNGKYSSISEYYTPVEITHTPDSVTSLTAFINYNDITLTWDEVSNAQNYYVYRKYGNGNWVVISYLQSESTFIDNSPIYDTNVYYGVKSEYINKFSAITSLESPVQITSADITVSNLDAKSLYSTNGIYLSWSKLSDSVTYHIYRREVDSSIDVEVGTTNNRNYFDQKSASNNILEDKIYYYKVLWSKSGSGIGGSLQTPVKGFFSNIIDTGEPDNSDRNNAMFNDDNISIDQTITSVLYKHGTLADTDWFRYTVPANSTHFINAHFLNFENLGLVEIYKDSTFISENQFPLSDIALTNSRSEEAVFYIRVIPNNKITLDDFTEEYNLNITTSF